MTLNWKMFMAIKNTHKQQSGNKNELYLKWNEGKDVSETGNKNGNFELFPPCATGAFLIMTG